MNEFGDTEMIPKALEIFPWNDNFSTGIDEIDDQHRRLVELLNILVSHLAFNADSPTLDKIFDELKDYAAVHFATEERIWGEHFNNDSWESWHRDVHRNFINQVHEIKKKEAEWSMDDVIAEIVKFLTHWLALHIIESDKRMAKVVLALPSGISLERAKEQANEEMTGSTRVLINTVMGMYDTLANRTIDLTREISRRLTVEEELRTTQAELLRLKNAAVEANQAKSAFLASMSHDIRTPMAGVIGMAEVLLGSSLNHEQRRMIHIIHDSAKAQLGILNDILDISKIEAGKLEFLIEPFCLADVIDNTCSNHEIHARQQDVILRHRVDSNIPRSLAGDALRVRQILSNFINNAIKFTNGLGRPGEVEVAARLAGEVDGRVWVELSVRDNGIGMDEATLDRVFSPFTQAYSSTTRKYGGTGLGLVISRRLIEALGGNIRVESAPDIGSMFTARLPFARADKIQLSTTCDTKNMELPQAITPGREEAIRQGRLILVAEDDDINQEVIQYQLDQLGYQCDIAPNGRAALEMWLTGAYALVLADILMPDMDGYQLAEAIRVEEAKRGAGRAPILALSANVLKGEADHCHAAGFDGYLTKPISLNQLRAVIDNHLQKPGEVITPPLSIMFLDDDTFMHDLLTVILEGVGQTEVSCFESAEAALPMFDGPGKPPDVIMLDINTPGMDGIQVVQQLAARRYSGCLILISGEDELMLRTTRRFATESGLDVIGVVHKPFTRQNLLAQIRLCRKIGGVADFP